MRKDVVYKLEWVQFLVNGSRRMSLKFNDISKEEKDPEKAAMAIAKETVKHLSRRSAKTAVLKKETVIYRFG